MKLNIFHKTTLLVCSLLTLAAIPSVAQGDGTHMSKVSTYDYNTHMGEITIENFVEGEVKVITKADPIYVTLVLDRSSSMKGNNWSNLKSAVVSFLGNLANYTDTYSSSGGNAYVSICMFGSDVKVITDWTEVNGSNKATLQANVNDQGTSGATQIGRGVKKGADWLKEKETVAGKKFMVIFTDGVPDDNEADDAINEATSVKSFADVYTIGLFSNDQNDAITIDKITGGIEKYYFRIKHFMEYMSSDFKNVKMTKLQWIEYSEDGAWNIAFTNGEITDGTIGGGYYSKIEDGSALDGIFNNIYSVISSGSSVTLEETTHIMDYMNSMYVKLPDNATTADVRIYKVPLTGYTADPKTFTFAELSESHRVTSGITVDVQKSTTGGNDLVNISGFSYSDDANWCGKHADKTIRGNKLVVKFPFVFKDGVEEMTGPIETNTGNSGVYVPDEHGELQPAVSYDVPEIVLCSITIQRTNLEAGESATYEIKGVTDPSFNVNVTLTGKTGMAQVEKTLSSLPAGSYTITETSWDWTFDNPTKTKNVILSESASSATVTFEGTPKEDIEGDTHAEYGIVNIMGLPGRVAE